MSAIYNFFSSGEKQIPFGAGLGGGSGNAAGTLKALNYLFRNSIDSAGLISQGTLHEIALELGSDVPFFIKPRPTEIRGRGDKLRDLPNYPQFHVVIIKPSFTISTHEAYINCIPKREISADKLFFEYLILNHNNDFERYNLNDL